jgi:hypothetical protein
MKTKITLVAITTAFCLLQNSVFAQDIPAIPSKNVFMAELNFKPFGENVISFNQLQLKYRIDNNLALRLGLVFDHNALDLKGDDYDPSEPRKITGNEKITKFGFLPGFEYHFLKNSKISPYWGIEFSIFKQSTKSHYRDYKSEYISGDFKYIPVEIDIDGATRKIAMAQFPGSSSYYTYYDYADRAYTSLGGNLLAGCDFYFMRHVYVGVEVGLGYNHIKTKKVTIDISDEVHPTILPSYTTGKFGFYYNSALRLGFWF